MNPQVRHDHGILERYTARIRPRARDQAVVPGQQCAWCDQSMAAQHGWQQPGQRRQDRPAGPVRLRP